MADDRRTSKPVYLQLVQSPEINENLMCYAQRAHTREKGSYFEILFNSFHKRTTKYVRTWNTIDNTRTFSPRLPKLVTNLQINDLGKVANKENCLQSAELMEIHFKGLGTVIRQTSARIAQAQVPQCHGGDDYYNHKR